MGDFANLDGELDARCGGELRDQMDDVGGAQVGGHHRFGYIDDDFDFVGILKLYDPFVRFDILIEFDESLGDHAIEGGEQRRITELNIRFDDAGFQPTYFSLLRGDVFLTGGDSLFEQLNRGLVIFRRDLKIGPNALVLDSGNRVTRHQSGSTAILRSRVGHFSRCRSHRPFESQALFRSIPG